MTEALPFVGALGGVAALITAIVVVLKVGVEKTDVKITTADKVMVGQDRFIESLEQSVQAANARITSLATQVDQMRTELRAVTVERDLLAQENRDLRDRVAHLEKTVTNLTLREGKQGVQGVQGERGEQGVPGIDGRIGDTGRTGDPGRTGPSGRRESDKGV